MVVHAHRERALSLLAAASNHGDLAVKLSSLRQVKDILSVATEPSFAAEVFPYLVELQSSPENLVRKMLIEMIEDIGLNKLDHSAALMPVLLSLSRDEDPAVAGQSIVTGINFFCSLLEEIALQFHHHGKVERWAEELWTWMGRFKDAMCSIIYEPASVGTKLVALKFLETYILLFTPVDSDKSDSGGKRCRFNVSWLFTGHPVLNPSLLISEANRLLITLLDLLKSAHKLPGLFAVGVVNCLAAIARKRAHHYDTVFNALLDFDQNLETASGVHAASVQYSLRTAFLGFLRCTHTAILETRDKLLRALRTMDAGDAADQVIRQVDKMIRNNDRALRDCRVIKDDQQSSQQLLSGDSMKKRPMIHEDEQLVIGPEMSAKRIRCNVNGQNAQNVQNIDAGSQHHYSNGVSSNTPLLNASLNPVEQMIAVIAALLAEGERGAESLEVLASEIHPDLLADIVVTNMKHLPKTPPSVKKLGSTEPDVQSIPFVSADQVVESPAVTATSQASVPQSQVSSTSAALVAALPDSSTSVNLPADSKRDPRRDPRRLDPRRVTVPVDAPCHPVVEETKPVQSGDDDPVPLGKAALALTSDENSQILSTHMDVDVGTIARDSVTETDHSLPNEEIVEGAKEISCSPDAIHVDLAVHVVEEKPAAALSEDVMGIDIADTPFMFEPDEQSPTVSNSTTSEESCQELPQVPAWVELSPGEQQTLSKLTIERIIRLYKHSQHRECCFTRMELITRLVSQVNTDDHVTLILQKEIVSDYQQKHGHDLVMHVLYHLESIKTLEAGNISLRAADVYEKFLLGVAKSLLDTLPAADKSFSRLLGEAPHLTGSALELLENICSSSGIDQRVKDSRDSDRVTQGLGAVWSLILGRPLNREACLNIALKCAVHPQDDIRTKAIRLVANKLYLLSYIADNVEQYATKMLLSAVDHASHSDPMQSGSVDKKTDEFGKEEAASVSGSQLSEALSSVDSSVNGGQPVSHSGQSISFPEAQRLVSLYFALCTKKPSLLRLIFDLHARAAKTVKQAINRHVPILVRALGSSSSELLSIISDPPEGSENLLMLALQVLTEQGTPSPDLIATVKHLYETKLQDATILIPMLSSLSKNEVLPIFPRLVDLPSDKFQAALDHILQGSAHTGPALTPAEALVALHDIVPEKEGIPLKKVMDACTTCFEQRMVFTEQVLEKALNHMVDRTPLPLLFMRTVIQAIDAYPSLVHFIMNILAKLVSKQIWKIPKLWVGFLKCVSQTQPHSYDVLLKLPASQLESALVKHGHLRAPLAAHVRQPNVFAAVPSSTLAVLQLVSDPQPQQRQLAHPPHAPDSVHGAAPT